jgi:hypothetical protein
MLDFKDRSPVVCREMTTQQHLMHYSEHKTRARIGLLQGTWRQSLNMLCRYFEFRQPVIFGDMAVSSSLIPFYVEVGNGFNDIKYLKIICLI